MEITAKGFVFAVELVPYRDTDLRETRPVHLPTHVVYRLASVAREESDPHALLEEIYTFGQNDFQPVPHRRSVSRGDVVVLDTDLLPEGLRGRYEVDTVGFLKLPEAS